jgi:aspartate aminotransferase-like enzyme
LEYLAVEGAVVAGGLAAYAGKMFRFGHMGNIDDLEFGCKIY